jgi:hypothetical protein
MDPEVRWVLANYVLLNEVYFVVGAVQGTVLLASSTDGTIPGWSGSPIEQVFWYAIAGVFFLSLFFGIPVLAAALLAWRVAIRVVGHPRLTAYIVAAVMVLAATVLIPRTNGLYISLFAVAPALVYATIVRLPPRGSTAQGDAV